MSELSIMDYILTRNTDKSDFNMDFKPDSELDMSTNYDNAELMTSEFFDSILSMEKTSECETETGLFDNLEMDMSIPSNESFAYDDMQCETSTFSDSGLSSDQQDVADQTLSDDELLRSILFTNPLPKPDPVCKVLKSVGHEKTQVKQPKLISISKPIQKSKQIIRVQPLNGNSRSVLLPINIKDLKTIKIINANSLKAENVTITPSVRPLNGSNSNELSGKLTHRHRNMEANVSGTNSSSAIPVNIRNVRAARSHTAETDNNECVDDNQYPLLLLTAEEKRLLSKDGIQLPCRYPLTKHEERELKRIRRKIRNKISAQDSRKRKKEYVDGLEERVKQCSEENRSLLKRIKLLQSQNSKLSSQLSKLQALVFKTGASRAHPATCVMIVLLSVMLVTLPNLRNAGGDKQLSTLNQCAQRRALLYSRNAIGEDEQATFSSMPATDSVGRDHNVAVDVLTNVTNDYGFLDQEENYEWGQDVDKNKQWSRPDPGISATDTAKYVGGARIPTKKQYIEPDIDESWPPEGSSYKRDNTISVSADHRLEHFNRTQYFT